MKRDERYSLFVCLFGWAFTIFKFSMWIYIFFPYFSLKVRITIRQNFCFRRWGEQKGWWCNGMVMFTTLHTTCPLPSTSSSSSTHPTQRQHWSWLLVWLSEYFRIAHQFSLYVIYVSLAVFSASLTTCSWSWGWSATNGLLLVLCLQSPSLLFSHSHNITPSCQNFDK